MSRRILGICCSPRPGQATFKAMQVCLAAAEAVSEAIETHLIELAGKSTVQEDPQAALVSAYRRKLSMMLN